MDEDTSIEDARAALSSARSQALSAFASAESQLSSADSELAQARSEFYEQRDAALEDAGLDGVITMEMVSAMIGAQNFSMPAGYVGEGDASYMVRVGDEFSSLNELKNMRLFSLGMETVDVVSLSDVASVEIVDNADDVFTKVNGEDGMLLSFQKQSNQSTADVAGRITEELEARSAAVRRAFVRGADEPGRLHRHRHRLGAGQPALGRGAGHPRAALVPARLPADADHRPVHPHQRGHRLRGHVLYRHHAQRALPFRVWRWASACWWTTPSSPSRTSTACTTRRACRCCAPAWRASSRSPAR